jgi:hypothetical protein
MSIVQLLPNTNYDLRTISDLGMWILPILRGIGGSNAQDRKDLTNRSLVRHSLHVLRKENSNQAISTGCPLFRKGKGSFVLVIGGNGVGVERIHRLSLVLMSAFNVSWQFRFMWLRTNWCCNQTGTLRVINFCS